MEGNMLHPVTCKRNLPEERKTSPAISHFRACAALSAGFTDYETFKVPQAASVWLILPHVRALVTKTFS
jgi:hypothetical protein